MLTEEKNRLLTQVGPGTPMGKYLRLYWHPIAGVSEFEEAPIKPVRVLGEDLVLFKDLSGSYGLIDRHCPHRRADMIYGYVEKEGIRCSYHGWQFDGAGQCVAQPFEDAVGNAPRFRENTRTTAYPVKEKAGMLWCYMGPTPAPPLPDWDLFNLPHGYAQVVFSYIPCNWFQTNENSIDPVHFEWTHNNWMTRLAGRPGPYSPTHIKLEFEEFEHGFVYRRLREGESEDNILWSVGRVMLWPNGFFLNEHFEYRVPIDDENTLSVRWSFLRVPKEREPYVQSRIPTWYGPVTDPVTGRYLTTHVGNQDYAAWVGQGMINDRTHERLAQSDKGVLMMRKRFFEELDAMEREPDFVPKGRIPDHIDNTNLELPSFCRRELIEGLSREELDKHEVLGPYYRDFIGQAGIPESVQREYEDAIGAPLVRSHFIKVHGSGR